MSREYEFKNVPDIFDYSNGWLTDNISKLFYATFNRLASVRKYRYKIQREYIDEIKQLYQEEEGFDLFFQTYFDTPHDGEEELILEKGRILSKDSNPSKDPTENYDCYVICKPRLMVEFYNEELFIAFSDIEETEVEGLLALADAYKKEKDSYTDLYIVASSHNFYYLKASHINDIVLNKETHYNDDFLPVAQEIERFLSLDNKSGLVILHGKQGTGKTSYIRYLIKNSKRRVIYMGGDLINKLADPNFITFICRYKDSVFVVEDCEELLASRNGSHTMNTGLINILNISDGLLGDELCLKFICTFNAPLTDIDTALLRKGRLVARYEFKDLSVEKVNKLIKEEGLAIPKQHRPMSLAEIFNYEGSDFTVERKKVGF